MAFPLVLLLTVMTIHAFHRPWWSYYYLHFAVPVAWLGAYAIAELLRLAWVEASRRPLRRPWLGYGCVVGASTLLALVLTSGGERLWLESDRIRHLPRVQESALIARIREYGDRTRWVYAVETIHPFHAGLLVIPELAVRPAKRFWSGQITEEAIWETVRRYRPEQLLLRTAPRPADVEDFVESGYVAVCQEQGLTLYVARELVPPAP